VKHFIFLLILILSSFSLFAGSREIGFGAAVQSPLQDGTQIGVSLVSHHSLKPHIAFVDAIIAFGDANFRNINMGPTTLGFRLYPAKSNTGLFLGAEAGFFVAHSKWQISALPNVGLKLQIAKLGAVDLHLAYVFDLNGLDLFGVDKQKFLLRLNYYAKL